METIMADNSNSVILHTFKPIYDNNSRILILGTMPSVKSREANFYYMHPQNLFWRIIPDILGRPFAETIEEKTRLLLSSRIALWDVLRSCEIEGSLDSSIRKPVPNDLSSILKTASINAIFTNGTKATSLYKTYCEKAAGMSSIYLPSTSPANKKFYNYDTIYKEWSKILDYIN
jgi:hypoxanthine-DNA glycosylase